MEIVAVACLRGHYADHFVVIFYSCVTSAPEGVDDCSQVSRSVKRTRFSRMSPSISVGVGPVLSEKRKGG